jgi:hypothetical protein
MVKDGRVLVGSAGQFLVLDVATGFNVGAVPLTRTEPGAGILALAPVVDALNRLFFFSGGPSLGDVLHAFDLVPLLGGGSAAMLWERDDLRAGPLSSANGILTAVHDDYQFAPARIGTVTLDPATGTPIQHFEGVPIDIANVRLGQPMPFSGDRLFTGSGSYVGVISMLATGPGVLPPLNLTALGGIGAIDLSWLNPPPQSFSIQGYDVYRSSFAGFNFGDPATQVTQVATTWFADTVYTGLTPGLLYYYVVKAVDENGNLSPPSNLAFASDPLDAELVSPPEGATVEGIVVMVGTAAGSEFAEYEIRIWPQGRPGLAVLVTQSAKPVLKGTLGQWLALTDLHGPHVVELLVKGQSGRTLTRRHTVHLGHAVYFTDILPDAIRAGNTMAEAPIPRPARRAGTDSRAPPRARGR